MSDNSNTNRFQNSYLISVYLEIKSNAYSDITTHTANHTLDTLLKGASSSSATLPSNSSDSTVIHSVKMILSWHIEMKNFYSISTFSLALLSFRDLWIYNYRNDKKEEYVLMYACTKQNDNLKRKIIFLMIFLILHAMDNKAAQYEEQQNFNTVLCYVMLSISSTSTPLLRTLLLLMYTQHNTSFSWFSTEERNWKNEITLKK